MAFNLQYLRPLGGYPSQGLYYYDGKAASDSLATVNTAGYFNNSDDGLNLTVDDVIVVNASDAQANLIVTAVSSGSVTTKVTSQGSAVASETGTTSTNLIAVGRSGLNSTVALTFNLDAPFAGAVKYIVNQSTIANVVEASTGTYDGTNNTMTFAALEAAVTLVGRSATRWDVLAVYPSSSYVAFS